jgi:hypothetical protein
MSSIDCTFMFARNVHTHVCVDKHTRPQVYSYVYTHWTHTHPHVYKLSHTHGPRYGDIVTMPSGLDDHIANGRLDSHITRLSQWLRKDTNWQVKLNAPETDDDW